MPGKEVIKPEAGFMARDGESVPALSLPHRLELSGFRS